MKEHIDTFTALLAGKSAIDYPHWRDAVRYAIDLMNAKPLDDAAEREHCRKAAEECLQDQNITDWLVCVTTYLMRENRRARAEGFAQGTERLFESENARSALTERVSNLAAKLSAAQAEIERLRNQVADLAEHDSAGARAYDALETKLSDLRLAAERAESLLGESEIAWHLRAMIKASR